MKKLTIDRLKWARVPFEGISPAGPSSLYNYRGGMCCLGFDCRFIHNVKSADLKDLDFPEQKDTLPSSFTSEEQHYLANINDRELGYESISDFEQEKLVKEKFKEKGIKVQFVN